MQTMKLTMHVLDLLNAGWVILDQKLQIVEFDPRFSEMISTNSSIKNQKITDVLPETIGLEDLLTKIVTRQKTTFTIPHIIKDVDPRDIRYLTLIATGTFDSDRPLLIFFLDETEQACILQKVQQQDFEIKLMRNLLNENQGAVAAGMIGSSKPMLQLKNTIEKLSKISSTVLIQGETGTGKSLVARMIHLATDNPNRPFIEFNCAAVPESLLESELFGHEKGAFTHALAQKKGLLEEANGGTLFLDEIGDIRLNLQAKLLTVLDSRKFRRLGSTKEIHTQFRLIAATNRDLESMVKEGTFREDLFYRIQVITLDCPPLRNLGDDIIQIVNHFIQVYAKEFGKPISGLTDDAKRKLTGYHWPGNVRELRNVIERAMIFAENKTLDSTDLQFQLIRDKEPVIGIPSLPEDGLSFEEMEKELLQQALKRADGNQSRAARFLKMSRDTFRYRLEKHKLLE